jgi:hypothetical protein
MVKPMKAIEITGSVNEQGKVELDQPLTTAKATRFRGILLFPDDETQEWSLSALKTSAINFLNDPEEDIYTLEDGRPVDHET